VSFSLTSKIHRPLSETVSSAVSTTDLKWRFVCSKPKLRDHVDPEGKDQLRRPMVLDSEGSLGNRGGKRGLRVRRVEGRVILQDEPLVMGERVQDLLGQCLEEIVTSSAF
jgi:hypothetical protein